MSDEIPMEIRPIKERVAEKRAGGRGEIAAPADAALSSIEPAATHQAAHNDRRDRRAALDELAQLGQELGIGYET
jgi:hypothetical protein